MKNDDRREEPREGTDERIERALAGLERVAPARDLSVRIIAALPGDARGQAPAWLGIATVLAALMGFGLVYQTAFLLRANGAFDLVSYYTTQPEIVTLYPDQAWSALVAVIPWMTVAISLVMLAVTLVLTYRWTARMPRIVG